MIEFIKEIKIGLHRKVGDKAELGENVESILVRKGFAQTMEVPKVAKVEVEITETEEDDKPKRKRRTKAEIEADKKD